LRWEVGNAFSAMFKRDRITLKKAKLALGEYQKIAIQFYNVELEEALEISDKLNIYAYDSYFLVCAKRFKSPLLSLDRKR
jgi:predicted nucleic acid-binding protein